VDLPHGLSIVEFKPTGTGIVGFQFDTNLTVKGSISVVNNSGSIGTALVQPASNSLPAAATNSMTQLLADLEAYGGLSAGGASGAGKTNS